MKEPEKCKFCGKNDSNAWVHPWRAICSDSKCIEKYCKELSPQGGAMKSSKSTECEHPFIRLSGNCGKCGEYVVPQEVKSECDCEKKSCTKDCTEKHTHKGFFCETCNPPDEIRVDSTVKPTVKSPTEPKENNEARAELLQSLKEKVEGMAFGMIEKEKLLDILKTL